MSPTIAYRGYATAKLHSERTLGSGASTPRRELSHSRLLYAGPQVALIGTASSETIAAVDRSVVPGHERHARDAAAFRADTFMHLPLTVAFPPPSGAALLAAPRFMHEAFFLVEFLLASSKRKRLAALHANYRPILG